MMFKKMGLITKAVLPVFLLISMGWFNSLLGQDTDFQTKTKAAALDTAALLSDDPIKSPGGAVLRSMILPGWGQLYNEKPFKAALVLGINGALAGSSIYYDQQWRDEQKNSDDPDKALRNRRNTFNWFLGLGYLLTLADAYVDAYLFKFDEAMNITLQMERPRSESLQFSIQVVF